METKQRKQRVRGSHNPGCQRDINTHGNWHNHLPAYLGGNHRGSLSIHVPILKKYPLEKSRNIALPIGGIGTGTVSLGGRGELRDWEIMNVPAKGYSTVTPGNDAPFFAIYAQQKNKGPITKGLLGPIDYADYQHAEGRSVNHHGLPRFKSSSFEASYPFGIAS